MKKVLFLGLLLFLPKMAFANLLLVEPEWTGQVAWHNDGIGWIPGQLPSYIGGPAGTNSFGGARQFNVSQTLNLDALLVDAIAHDNNPGRVDSLNFKFTLYQGDSRNHRYVDFPDEFWNHPIPDARNSLLSSDVHFEDDTNLDRLYTDYEVPFDITLEPGTYWLSAETAVSGGGTMVSDIHTTFVDPPTIATPEPATWLLFGVGGMALLKRKKTFHAKRNI